MLRPWFIPVKDIFRKYNKHVLDVADNESHRIFIDRGGSVLFVAHLDTIQKPKIFKRSNENVIYGQGFDDRLGCMLAFNLSEKLGADLLLTDHEEACGTTGKYHKLKDYNWIVGFDREGTDVVTYRLDNLEFRSVLGEYWGIGFGSYSDICDLKTKACCFNLGIGHYQSHSKKACVFVKETEKQIDKFKLFYAEHKDMKYVRDVQQHDHWVSEDMVCEFCGSWLCERVFDSDICSACFQDMRDHYTYKDSVDMCDYCYEDYPTNELSQVDSFNICEKCESHVFI